MRLNFLLITAVLLLTACAGLQTADPVAPLPEPPADPVAAMPAEPPEFVGPPEPEAPAQDPAMESGPSPVHYATIWERIADGFGMPDCREHESALAWARWYADRPDYLERVFQRAEPWLYYIAEETEKRGLPTEFVLLPIVESAFDPFAYSRGRAVGIWQFIAGTGRRYGLRQNWWYDGRRDVYAATPAALNYLRDLGAMFEGDWLLALAGYNSGEHRVKRQVKRQQRAGRPSDFWNLRLPRETRGYIPKLLGLQCMLNDPEGYGVDFPDIPNEPLITAVEVESQTDLVIAAGLAGMSIEELFRLNAGFNRWATSPDGPGYLVVPRENAPQLAMSLARQSADALMRWDQITVKAGDTLGKLAREYGVPLSVLRTANQGQGDMIRIGQRLRLPREGNDRLDPLYASAADELQRLQARLVAPNRSTHRIRPGESLSAIARRYRVSVADLQRWNNIADPHRIRAGKTLTVFQSQVAPSTGKASKPTMHVVQRGDSLWSISRKYRVKLNDLMRWNQLDSTSILQPGQRLNLML